MTFRPGDLPDLPRRSTLLSWEKLGLWWGVYQEQIFVQWNFTRNALFFTRNGGFFARNAGFSWIFMDFRDVDLSREGTCLKNAKSDLQFFWGGKNVTCQDCCAFLRPKLPSEPTLKCNFHQQKMETIS